MRKGFLLLLSIISVLAHGALAEVFKCVDEAGAASYRDTGCREGESNTAIDRRYSNRVPLNFTPEDAKAISGLAKETRQDAARHVKHRDAQIRLFVRDLERKQARCEELKDRYQAMHVHQRRFGRTDADAMRDLIHQMRDACSG